MDLTIFMTGTGIFGAGFFFLLFCLLRKKKLVLPFILMGTGVVLCFLGLILSSPLTVEAGEHSLPSMEQSFLITTDLRPPEQALPLKR